MEEKALKTVVYGNKVFANVGEGIRGVMGDTPRHFYVAPFGDDTHDGLTWESSFCTIAKALSVACAGDTIRVCEGTYYEVVKK